MNAAARLVHQNVLSRHLVFIHLLTRRQFAVMMLGMMVLLSALSIIYITQTTRTLHATYERHLVERDRLHIERGQLLLERSADMMQSRIQQIAENKLGMVAPTHHSIVMIRE